MPANNFLRKTPHASGLYTTYRIPNGREEVVDVVGEVARFRREKKAEAEREWRRGRRWVDGYWEGKVEVVRPFG